MAATVAVAATIDGNKSKRGDECAGVGIARRLKTPFYRFYNQNR